MASRRSGAHVGAAVFLACTVACAPCKDPVHRVAFADMPNPKFQATIGVSAATFSTTLVVTYGGGGCLDFLDRASASVGGVALEHHALATTRSCDCFGYPGFEVTSATLPGSGDGTYTLTDGGSPASMTVASLFAQRSVSLRGTSVLKIGSRVYLDFFPATDQVSEIVVAFTHKDSTGNSITDFRFTNYDGSYQVQQDAGGWYFVVPNVTPVSGTLWFFENVLKPQVLTCTGVTSCEAFTSHTEQIATSIVQ